MTGTTMPLHSSPPVGGGTRTAGVTMPSPLPTAAGAAPVLATGALCRTFGDVVALDDVTLTVHPGELVGLLGPNGAGKTTLLSLVCGLRCPTSGTVRLFGGDPRDAAIRTRLGTTPQETGLPPTLRVGEVVDFVAGHYPDAVPTAQLLEQFGLAEVTGKQTGALSGGQKRRLAVALSLVGRPRLVLLDEPTTGLDVSARQALWNGIRAYHAAGGTVLLTSHYLEEVQALAERVVVIDHGRVLVDDALESVLQRVAVRRVLLTSPSAAVADLPGIVSAEHTGDRHQLYTADADAFVRALVASELPFAGLEVRGASLEEAVEQMLSHEEVAR